MKSELCVPFSPDGPFTYCAILHVQCATSAVARGSRAPPAGASIQREGLDGEVLDEDATAQEAEVAIDIGGQDIAVGSADGGYIEEGSIDSVFA